MNAIVFAGVAAAVAATVAVGALVRPALAGRIAWPALAATAAAAVVVIGLGRALALGSWEFLIGITVFTLPVLLLLEAASFASGADGFARWTLMLGWGVVVFPATALVPFALTSGCFAPDCGFEDFGAGLPLTVSAAAYVLLARVPAGVHERAPRDRASGRRVVLAGLLFWIATAVWLAHLEGVVDEFIPRILMAAVVGPVAGAVGWLLVDVLRDTRVSVGRSLALGLVAGMVGALPGAVSIAVPWSVIVGLLAGGLAALFYSLPRMRRAGLASRWGVSIVSAAAVGFLAPPVSGDTIGLIFAARASVLVVPVLMLLGVTAFSLLVSAPVWALVARHAARERIPEGIVE
ncbi:MAG: hypothetical protein ACTHKX_02015 [Pseudolysinimonas sp.]